MADAGIPGHDRLVVTRHLLLFRAVLGIASVLWLGEVSTQTPWPAAMAAASLGILGLSVLALCGRKRVAPREIAEAGSLHGALVAAACAATLNEIAVHGLAVLTGSGTEIPAAAGALAAGIEEIVKLASLVLLLAVRPDGPVAAEVTVESAGRQRDGMGEHERGRDPESERARAIVLGAAVGIGFAASENLVYLTFALIQGGTLGLWKGLYLRGLLGGVAHAVFTGTAAAGVVPRRPSMPSPGDRANPSTSSPWLPLTLGAAVAQHSARYLFAAPIISD